MTDESPSTFTKIDAVREAIKTLGKSVMPGQIREYVHDKFGMDMTLAHISNYKTQILRKKKRQRSTKSEPAEDGEPSTPTVVKSSSSSSNGVMVRLEDIEAVKDLVARIGAVKLKALIGLLA